MNKLLPGFVIGSVFGLIAGAGIMLVAFPFLFPPLMMEETVAEGARLLGKARFRTDAPGQDAIHWGRGGIKYYYGPDNSILLELQKDFEVGPGPNLWIYLNHIPDIGDEADFMADDARLRLTKLKSFTGSQVYEIKADDFANTKAITIWCDSFNQYIASANLP